MVGEQFGSLSLWHPTNLGVLGSFGGNGASAGRGHGGQPSTSADGTRVAANLDNAGGVWVKAIFDIATGLSTPLGNIGASIRVEASSSRGTGRNAQHLAALQWISRGTARAIRWSQATGVVDTGSTVPGSSCRAKATTKDGSVVAGWQDTHRPRQLLSWIRDHDPRTRGPGPAGTRGTAAGPPPQHLTNYTNAPTHFPRHIRAFGMWRECCPPKPAATDPRKPNHVPALLALGRSNPPNRTPGSFSGICEVAVPGTLE